jgi:hypothetical protein
MPGISIGNLSPCLGNRSQSWQAYWKSRNYTDRVDHYFGSNLVAHWPLNETSGILAAARGIVPSSNNFINNGGFEGDAFGMWSVTGGTAVLTTTAGEVHSGVKAMKVTAGAGTAVFYATISVIPGKKYQLKFWIKGDGSNLSSYDIAREDWGAYVVSPTSTGVSGTDYTEVTSVEFTAPATFRTVILEIKTANVAGAYFCIDDMTFAQTEAVTIDNLSGVYKKATLNQTGFRTGENSVYFDGSAGSGIPLSTLIASEFPSLDKGTLLIWVKPTLASLTDGVARFAVKFKTSADSGVANYIDISKRATNNQLYIQFKDDTMLEYGGINSFSSSEWACIGVTWDNTVGLKCFLNGVQQGATVAMSGVWTKIFDGNFSTIGAEGNGLVAFNWAGWLSHCVLGKTALSAEAMKWLGQPLSA